MVIPDYASAPDGWGEVWQRYVEKGISPGSFGRALLCNNLAASVLRADPDNKAILAKHVQWLWENMPAEAWGSEEAYEQWTSKKY